MTESSAGIGTCQVCGDAMQGGVHRCAACDTPHHRVCWEYLGGCSTYACSAGAKPLAVMNSAQEIQVVLDPGRYVNPGTLVVDGTVAAYTPAGAKAPILPGDHAFELPLSMLDLLRAGRDQSRLGSIAWRSLALVLLPTLFTGGIGLPIGITLATLYLFVQAFRTPQSPEGVTNVWLARDAQGKLQLLMLRGKGGEPAQRGEATGAGRSPASTPGSPGEGTTSGSAQRSGEPGEPLRLPAQAEFQLVLSRTPSNRVHAERAWVDLEADVHFDPEYRSGPPSSPLLPPVTLTGADGHTDGEQRALAGQRRMAQLVAAHLKLKVIER